MSVTIDDKIIFAKVMKTSKAEKKYDDAIAAGNQATLLKESNDNNDLH